MENAIDAKATALSIRFDGYYEKIDGKNFFCLLIDSVIYDFKMRIILYYWQSSTMGTELRRSILNYSANEAAPQSLPHLKISIMLAPLDFVEKPSILFVISPTWQCTLDMQPIQLELLSFLTWMEKSRARKQGQEIWEQPFLWVNFFTHCPFVAKNWPAHTSDPLTRHWQWSTSTVSGALAWKYRVSWKRTIKISPTSSHVMARPCSRILLKYLTTSNFPAWCHLCVILTWKVRLQKLLP